MLKVFLLFTTIAFQSFGQINLSPAFILNFDLHPDSIQKQRDLYHLIDSLYKIDNPSDSIKAFLAKQDLETLEGDDPFDIGPIGCSWYCGGGPEKISSSIITDSLNRAEMVHDFNLKSSWKASIKNNELTFLFNLNSVLNTTDIIIFSGNCSSLKNWKAFSRPKEILLEVNDSLQLKLNLLDDYSGQGFNLKSFLPKNQSNLILKLKILSVYPGLKEKNFFHIAEINFDGIGDH